MQYENDNPLMLDEEKFARLKRQIQIRSQIAEEVNEQLSQNQLTWLATPLPWRIRLKLQIKRLFRKSGKTIAAIRQWNDAPR